MTLRNDGRPRARVLAVVPAYNEGPNLGRVISEILALEVELEILEGCGLTFEKAEFVRRFMGTADAQFHDLLDAESRSRLGRPLRADFIEMAHDARKRICREKLAEVPGARAVALAIAAPKAVASSSRSDFLREKLSLANLIDVFDPHDRTHVAGRDFIDLDAAQLVEREKLRDLRLGDAPFRFHHGDRLSLLDRAARDAANRDAADELRPVERRHQHLQRRVRIDLRAWN